MAARHVFHKENASSSDGNGKLMLCASQSELKLHVNLTITKRLGLKWLSILVTTVPVHRGHRVLAMETQNLLNGLW